MRFSERYLCPMVTRMAELPSSPPARPPHGGGCLKWLALILCGILLVGGVLTWKFFDTAWPAFRDGIGWVRDLPAKLTSEQVTLSFRESVTQIASTHGDILETATLETDETVTKYDLKTALSDFIYLGTTTSEIRTPVVYRYHIRLSDDWHLRVEGARCIVHAPALRPSLPPAVRTERMEKKSEAGWLRFNAAENLAALEKDLTPMLEKRAGNKNHIDLVREASRKSVAEFVKKWLLQSQLGKEAPVSAIVVVFPDEVAGLKDPMTLPPTLTVEKP